MSSDVPSPQKHVWRRRRANAVGGRPHQHMVRVSAWEEAQLRLRADAQDITVPRLLVERALADGAEAPAARREQLTALFVMRRQLSRLANNVNQIARVVNTDGQLPVGSAETLAQIKGVVDEIQVVIEGLAIDP